MLLNILRQKTEDEQVKRYAVTYMEGKGSFGYCKEVLAEFLGRARAEVAREEVGEGRERMESILGLMEVE